MIQICLRCEEKYETEEQERYYCSFCLTAKQKLAKELDRKRAMNPPKPVKSDLQIYDESPKVHGFLRVKL